MQETTVFAMVLALLIAYVICWANPHTVGSNALSSKAAYNYEERVLEADAGELANGREHQGYEQLLAHMPNQYAVGFDRDGGELDRAKERRESHWLTKAEVERNAATKSATDVVADSAWRSASRNNGNVMIAFTPSIGGNVGVDEVKGSGAESNLLNAAEKNEKVKSFSAAGTESAAVQAAPSAAATIIDADPSFGMSSFFDQRAKSQVASINAPKHDASWDEDAETEKGNGNKDANELQANVGGIARICPAEHASPSDCKNKNKAEANHQDPADRVKEIMRSMREHTSEMMKNMHDLESDLMATECMGDMAASYVGPSSNKHIDNHGSRKAVTDYTTPGLAAMPKNHAVRMWQDQIDTCKQMLDIALQHNAPFHTIPLRTAFNAAGNGKTNGSHKSARLSADIPRSIGNKLLELNNVPKHIRSRLAAVSATIQQRAALKHAETEEHAMQSGYQKSYATEHGQAQALEHIGNAADENDHRQMNNLANRDTNFASSGSGGGGSFDGNINCNPFSEDQLNNELDMTANAYPTMLSAGAGSGHFRSMQRQPHIMLAAYGRNKRDKRDERDRKMTTYSRFVTGQSTSANQL